ncbi:ABC transporter permease (plasmid) [Pseudorhodobacter turbinis]|uniref:ABC transporter permease n=1 Tax=Pseudorhodobacter turbinis TaxID=2500533 RepID=A0A4P8EIN7_9RHOB|nr:ABC transporter permease [Pseudorhodobacter turbinis]QCO56693.1 ABC transporter permease [Pseudorhodobacter turbinis]
MANPDITAETDVLRTVDGQPLKAALTRASRRARIRAFFLVVPLLIFVLLTFAVPIGQMLSRSFTDDKFSANMVELGAWFDANGDTAPDEAAYAALAADLKTAAKSRTAGSIGTRVNYEIPGTRSLFTSTARRADKLEPPYKGALLAANEKWGRPDIWAAMRSASAAATLNFYQAALDRQIGDSGKFEPAPENSQIYVKLFIRTFVLSVVITGLCLLLGFPVAHLLAVLPLRHASLLMILVLLPFWTSLLVRTTSWMVLLQGQGVINDVLVSLGIVSEDGRLEMMYNQLGTIIAMTHILLPFMILPLYSVMKTIPPSYARAARSLGATSWTTFRRIYLPQTVSGIGAGGILCFILAVGYYITPALVGGADGTLISNQIAFHMQKSLNWSLAAALASMLLAAVLILYWAYDRIIGIDNMKLG